MPLQETLQTSQTFFARLASEAAAFLPNLAVAILILAVGFFIAGRLANLVSRAFGVSARIDQTVQGRWSRSCATSSSS